ncbi:uncharacterized protein [Amphiura filiformis]|uniref:uncharacterized protein n=1 Tax=Amphiura filiformis TaxID=82378 RepID=UPI003B226402
MSTGKYQRPENPEEGPVEFLPKKSRCSSSFQLIHNIFLWAIIIVLGVALVWLSSEVHQLKQNEAITPQMESGIPQQMQSHGDTNSRFRSRRDSHASPRQAVGAGWSTFGNQQNNTQPLIHVTHITSNELERGDWFTWHSDQDETYQDLASQHMIFNKNKFIEINQPGYYFVYSQITYSDIGYYSEGVIGHEIVKKSSCGKGDDRILLSSRQSQIDVAQVSNMTTDFRFGPNYPKDSGYTAGVFYLSTNDYIGVRPLSDATTRLIYRYANLPEDALMTGSSFGAFMLASDPHSRLAEMRECCDGGILML